MNAQEMVPVCIRTTDEGAPVRETLPVEGGTLKSGEVMEIPRWQAEMFEKRNVLIIVKEERPLPQAPAAKKKVTKKKAVAKKPEAQAEEETADFLK